MSTAPVFIQSLAQMLDEISSDLDNSLSEQQLEDRCIEAINSLIGKELLIVATNGDEYMYMLKPGVTQEMCDDASHDMYEKMILNQFIINNKKGTFVMFNTQKGKTNIVIKKIRNISCIPGLKPVYYMLVSNDKTLADQSAESMQSQLEDNNCKVFTLSSNSKTSFEDLKTHIDAYIHTDDNEYKTPVIIALDNNHQITKILKLMAHVQYKNQRNINIKNVPMFDEADVTYPKIRDKCIQYKAYNAPISTTHTFLELTDENNPSLHEIVWISATEGDLLSGKYPECEKASNHECEEDEIRCENYRAMHHHECIPIIYKQKAKESRNGYAERLIIENRRHFDTPYTLPSGEIYYKKCIINSNAKVSDMVELASTLKANGFHCITVNQNGITLYKFGEPCKKVYTTKGKRFNKVLFDVYKDQYLNDRPLAIIGNKKVNRGISYHYAPSDGSDGLVWTDMILGNIDDVPLAVQKAGRLAGKISQCMQYPGNLWYWTTEKTWSSVVTHNRRVDDMNMASTGNTIKQSFECAREKIKQAEVKHNVDPSKFKVYKDITVMNRVVRDICGKDYRFQPPDSHGFIHTSLNSASVIASVFEGIKKVDSGFTGKKDESKGGRTVYPCYLDTDDVRTLLYVVLLENLDASDEDLERIEREDDIKIPHTDVDGNLITELKRQIFDI